MSNPKTMTTFAKVRLLILFNLILIGLVRLGVWQYHKYLIKTDWIEQQQRLSQQPPLELKQLQSTQIVNYLPVHIQGRWLQSWQFMLDNRQYKGKNGYHPFALFEDKSGKKIWIDRGWHALGTERHFEKVLLNNKQSNLIGQIYIPEDYQLVELPSITKNELNIQPGLNLTHIVNQMQQNHIEVAPFIIRQTFPDNESSLIKKWEIVSIPPERHLGYAIQWFLMALAFIILSIKFYRKSIREHHES